MKGVTSLIKNANWASMSVAVVAGVFAVTLIAEAATTISTSVVTGGGVYATSSAEFDGAVTLASTLNVTGQTTLANASTTNLSANTVAFGGLATTSISSAGAVAILGTLNVTGQATFANASTTNVSGKTAAFGGSATTSVNTSGQLTVGTSGNAITDMSVGFCTIPDTPITASSSAYAVCTTNVTISASDRVFVQATSSLPVDFIIQAASTTGATTLSLRIYNSGITAQTTTGARAINFWAAR